MVIVGIVMIRSKHVRNAKNLLLLHVQCAREAAVVQVVPRASALLGTRKVIPTPDFRISPDGRKHRGAQENKEQPGGRSWGVGISSRMLALRIAGLRDLGRRDGRRGGRRGGRGGRVAWTRS